MNSSKQVLIRIYLYIFRNTFSDIKILDKNIKNTILKKAEKNEKNRKKAEDVAGLIHILIYHNVNLHSQDCISDPGFSKRKI
jgi:hypothetical protein